ncbi:MAG: hypothetical protein AABZ39_16840, partial [Spirochaetota bacterium]
MSHHVPIKLLCAFAVIAVVSLFGAAADELYQKILATSGLHEKEALGRRLGEMNTPDARTALLTLMNESSYWNRLAAV